MCVGIQLVDLIPPGARGPDISEGCGGPEYLNVGKEVAADGAWTILNGKAPEKSKKIKVKKADGSAFELPVVEDGKGINGKWVVQKLNGRLGDVEFEALDSQGKSLARHKLSE